MPIPQSATDAIKWIDRCDSSGDWGRGQFASSVDAVFVGAHQATLPQEVKLLSTAVYTAAVEETSSSPTNLVIVTPAGRDALVALSMYATTDDSVESLAKTLLYFVTIPRAEALLTPLV
ncbi:Hypothetical protein, putative [Bodo saltans]|uniref:Uncharacterized protein n=1 Tax=Bodo saltans TaxID=75058 RepID=A0A0S4J3G2_BODSA|nr:Hypothetical protein, putative [Bodo saltans]|eukprot:CUG77442.1 Hypothetical protein, putative [Bodo saltans]